MKKTILALLFAAAVAAVAVVACKKEETDFDKGKKDGKAYCDCLVAAAASGNQAAFLTCLSKLDLTKMNLESESEGPSNDYERGVQEGGKACKDLDFGD